MPQTWVGKTIASCFSVFAISFFALPAVGAPGWWGVCTAPQPPLSSGGWRRWGPPCEQTPTGGTLRLPSLLATRRVSGGTDLVCRARSAEPGPGHPACLPLPRLQGMSLPSVLAGDSWLRFCPEGPAEAEAEALQQADPGSSLAHPGNAPMALALSSGHPCAFITQGTHAVSARGTGCGPRPPERLDPLPWTLWRVEGQRARAQTRPPGVTPVPGAVGRCWLAGGTGLGSPAPQSCGPG